jgi:cell division transport system ATP-binding protein
MSLLQEINKLGTTVLMVTHDQNLVEFVNKRVVAIEEGVVVSDGMEEEEDFYAEDFYGEEDLTYAAE